jgi:hypothetical protein
MTTYKMPEVEIQRLEQELRNEYNRIKEDQTIVVEESVLDRKLKEEALYLPVETRNELDAISKAAENYSSVSIGEGAKASLASIFADDI